MAWGGLSEEVMTLRINPYKAARLLEIKQKCILGKGHRDCRGAEVGIRSVSQMWAGDQHVWNRWARGGSLLTLDPV